MDFQLLVSYYLCGLFCCIQTYFALSALESSWTVFQYEGIDELFDQIQQSDAGQEFNGVDVESVCGDIKRKDLSRVLNSNILSSIRSQIPNAKYFQPNENGYQLFIVNGYEVYLYPCKQFGDSETYFLSHAFDANNLFFLFIYNHNTEEMALEGLVQEEASSWRSEQVDGDSDLDTDVESIYISQKEAFYNHLQKTNPGYQYDDNDLSWDPICSLSVNDKVRLCASVLNTSFYRDQLQYTFFANVNKVDSECTEIHTPATEVYEEGIDYMYQCFMNDDVNNMEVSIYLSRGYRNNEVFVHSILETVEGIDVVRPYDNIGNLYFIREFKYVPDLEEQIVEDEPDLSNQDVEYFV